MDSILMEGLENIVGLPCVDLRIGYADTLIVGFGRLVEYAHPKLKGKQHGEWELRNSYSRWRIVLDGRIVTGDFDSERGIKEYFDSMVGITLLDVSSGQISTDLVMNFNDGHKIQIFSSDQSHESWELLGPENSYHSRQDGIFGAELSNDASQLTATEITHSNHAEDCHERWKLIVPESGPNACKACTYYENLESGFYFYDYGVCTNQKSKYDGSIVRFNSYCKQHVENQE